MSRRFTTLINKPHRITSTPDIRGLITPLNDASVIGENKNTTLDKDTKILTVKQNESIVTSSNMEDGI